MHQLQDLSPVPVDGSRVAVNSSGAVGVDQILACNVCRQPDIDALATSAPGAAAVMMWNYSSEENPGPAANVHLTIQGINPAAHRVLLQQYRVDNEHSNAYTVWQQMGSPQQPTPEQYAKLQAGGQLALFDSPRWVTPDHGRLEAQITLPREGISLLRITWTEK